MSQPPVTLRNDGQDELRLSYYNLRESALAFGMTRDEFNRLARLSVPAGAGPAEWLAVGHRIHEAAILSWTREENARREERIRRRAENQKSFREEAERRAKRFRQIDEHYAARRAA